jgi:restriction system protein
MVMDKCSNCGAPVENGRCSYCGTVYEKPGGGAAKANSAAQPQVVVNVQTNQNANATPQAPTVSRQSKWAAFFLCFFLGYFGAHYFYVGKAGMGILYLFTGGLFGIGWFVDLIRIGTGSFRDKYGALLEQ